MKEEKAQKFFALCIQILPVDINELAAGINILPAYAQKGLNGFLLQAVQPQKRAKGLYFFVDIQAADPVKGIGKAQTAAAFEQIGNVKAIAVEMDENLKILHKSKKSVQKLGLRISCVGKPLNHPPAKAVEINTANQVELGSIAGKSGSLYIKEENIFPGGNSLQRVGIWKCNGVLDRLHLYGCRKAERTSGRKQFSSML